MSSILERQPLEKASILNLETILRDPEKAKAIAQEAYSPRALSDHVLKSAFFSTILSDSEMSEIRACVMKLAPYAVEAVRTSPRFRCNGSYDKARKYLLRLPRYMRVHDVIHIDVEWREEHLLVPRYLQKPPRKATPAERHEASVDEDRVETMQPDEFVALANTIPEIS